MRVGRIHRIELGDGRADDDDPVEAVLLGERLERRRSVVGGRLRLRQCQARIRAHRAGIVDVQDKPVLLLRAVVRWDVERIREIKIPVLAIRLIKAVRGVECRAVLDGVQLIPLDPLDLVSPLLRVIVRLWRAALPRLRIVADIRLLRVIRDRLIRRQDDALCRPDRLLLRHARVHRDGVRAREAARLVVRVDLQNHI